MSYIAGLTDYVRDNIMKRVFGVGLVPPSIPVVAAIGLGHSVTQDGDFTEPTADSYERLSVSGTLFADFYSSVPTVLNTEILEWPELTEDWGLVTHVLFLDSLLILDPDDTKLLAYAPLPNTPRKAVAGCLPHIEISDLHLQFVKVY